MTPGAEERARELAAAAYKEWDESQSLSGDDLEEVIARHLAGALAAVRLEEARWWAEFAILTQHTRDCTFNSTDGPVGDYCDCGRSQRLKLMRERWQKLERAVEGK